MAWKVDGLLGLPTGSSIQLMITDYTSSDHTLGDTLDDAEADPGYDGVNDNTGGHGAKRERIPLWWRSPLASLMFACRCGKCT